MELYIFYLIATIAVVSSLLMITRSNMVHSTIFLITTLLAIAGLYFLLEAEFLAVVQIIIYAGAIITMFVFVILALGSSSVRENYGFRVFAMSVLGILLSFELINLFSNTVFSGSTQGLTSERITASGGNIQVVSKILLDEFLFPFEILSFILLAAMIGVFVLTRKPKTEEDTQKGEK